MSTAGLTGRACARRLACAALAWLPVVAPATAGIVVMHGPAEVTSVVLWIQTDAPRRVEVSWRIDGEPVDRSVELAAGARAPYCVDAGGQRRVGTVRAQPFWSRSADAQPITVAIGSCFFLADIDPRWGKGDYGGEYEIPGAVADTKPDVMLWLGDNLYLQRPDFVDPASMAARYRGLRAFEPLQKLLTAAPQLAIWDDHDYGPNDGDGSCVLKGETLKLFQRYWPNPSFALPEVPGTFGFAQYGDPLFFLLDDCCHRSPERWPDGADKAMYGVRQFDWLKQALTRAPRGSIKIVAGGNQFWNRPHRFESRNHFRHEQLAFADWLLERRIEGVIFLSGDRHFGELLKTERPGAYPLYEFTSSPLASRPPNRVDKAGYDSPDRVAGTLFNQRQFGLVRVTGAGDRREIAFESCDSQGTPLWKQVVAAASLRFPRSKQEVP